MSIADDGVMMRLSLSAQHVSRGRVSEPKSAPGALLSFSLGFSHKHVHSPPAAATAAAGLLLTLLVSGCEIPRILCFTWIHFSRISP